MNPELIDHPLVLARLFHPRAARPSSQDGTIPVDDGIVLGYRPYVHRSDASPDVPPDAPPDVPPDAPVVVFFHGNGEIASDYDFIAPEYHAAGVSLLVVDYRGYGWSTGSPKTSALLPDVEAVVEALPDVFNQTGLTPSAVYMMGRSLGSACAIHAAYRFPNTFRGLIIESGFADVLPLLTLLGIPPHLLVEFTDPFDNLEKMYSIGLPLLVIHGQRDTLIPVQNGQDLYDASPAALKRLLRIPGAGHNDLLLYADRYFAALERFVTDTLEHPA